ncbi:hypothetical protein, partial [Amphritea sp.]|uniref:hypothetical protein n=1 Tax=Amphritea sp. TaxID=1872502 RepID=UPI003D0FD051
LILFFFPLLKTWSFSTELSPLFFSILLPFLKHGAFQMGFHLFCFSILAPLSFFLGSFFCWGEIPLIGIF